MPVHHVKQTREDATIFFLSSLTFHLRFLLWHLSFCKGSHTLHTHTHMLGSLSLFLSNTHTLYHTHTDTHNHTHNTSNISLSYTQKHALTHTFLNASVRSFRCKCTTLGKISSPEMNVGDQLECIKTKVWIQDGRVCYNII